MAGSVIVISSDNGSSAGSTSIDDPLKSTASSLYQAPKEANQVENVMMTSLSKTLHTRNKKPKESRPKCARKTAMDRRIKELKEHVGSKVLKGLNGENLIGKVVSFSETTLLFKVEFENHKAEIMSEDQLLKNLLIPANGRPIARASSACGWGSSRRATHPKKGKSAVRVRPTRSPPNPPAQVTEMPKKRTRAVVLREKATGSPPKPADQVTKTPKKRRQALRINATG